MADAARCRNLIARMDVLAQGAETRLWFLDTEDPRPVTARGRPQAHPYTALPQFQLEGLLRAVSRSDGLAAGEAEAGPGLVDGSDLVVDKTVGEAGFADRALG